MRELKRTEMTRDVFEIMDVCCGLPATHLHPFFVGKGMKEPNPTENAFGAVSTSGGFLLVDLKVFPASEESVPPIWPNKNYLWWIANQPTQIERTSTDAQKKHL